MIRTGWRRARLDPSGSHFDAQTGTLTRPRPLHLRCSESPDRPQYIIEGIMRMAQASPFAVDCADVLIAEGHVIELRMAAASEEARRYLKLHI